MSDIAEQRQKDVSELIANSREILGVGNLNRHTLSTIATQLAELAGKTHYWTGADFAEPDESEKQNRYRINGDGDSGITLYLNVMRPGKKIPPHDHTTWACVAAVSGIELNTLYDRLDDGSAPGKAEIRIREEIELGPGMPIALMPDDIHSVEIPGEDVIRHLHFYGQPLETLSRRKMFDLNAGTYRIMDIGVKSKTREC